jgi:hypothetical protein
VNSVIFVAECTEKLLPLLKGRSVVASAYSIEEMRKLPATARKLDVDVHCVQLHTKAPLASLLLRAEEDSFPIALFPSEIGRLQDLVRILPVLRDLNIRVYLPANNAGQLKSIRILASLGIDCAVLLDGGGVLWDLLTDLMTYALLGLAPHASIEPFQLICGNYDPRFRAAFGSVYFDDPVTYLHVNEQGGVALTRDDLRAGRLVAASIEDATESVRSAAYDAHCDLWKNHFLTRTKCASCPGWRVCVGRFAAWAEAEPGCTAFFAEMMDVIDNQHKGQKKVKKTWLP